MHPTGRPTRARRALHALVLAGMLAAGGAPSLRAQASVAGAVRDSLADVPLAGARVELVLASDPGASRRAIDTDAAGRYRIEDVPPGRYLIGFLHQRLDALGMQIQLPPLEVRSADTLVRVDLAVPGGHSMNAAVCGARGDSSGSGVIVGRVVRAETSDVASEGAVTVRWQELFLSRDAAPEWRERDVSADADAAGRFVACGVPIGVPLLVAASAGSERSGTVELVVPPSSVLERDLLVAAPVATTRRRARLTGRVRREDASELSGARVSVRAGGADVTAAVETDGSFALDELPAGTRMLEVRAIGFTPRHVTVDLVNGRTATVDVVLDKRVATLDTLRVSARETLHDWTGFAERARGGWGHFMDEARIKSMHLAKASDLLSTLPGIQVIPTVQPYGARLLTRGVVDIYNTPCMPDVFIDGMQVPDGASSLDRYVNSAELVGIELYTDLATVPVQYHRGSCGAVVVWTRNRPTR